MNKKLLLWIFVFTTVNSEAQNLGIGTNSPKNFLLITGGFYNQPLCLIGSGTSITIPDNQSNINLIGQFSVTLDNPVNGQRLIIENNSNQTGAFIGEPDIRNGLNEYIFRAGDWEIVKTIAWVFNEKYNTNPTINFIGTIDNIDVIFKRNSADKMSITENGIEIVGNGVFTGNVKTPFIQINGTSMLSTGLANSLRLGGSNFTAGGYFQFRIHAFSVDFPSHPLTVGKT